MALQVAASYVDLTRGARYGDEPWYDAFTDDRGVLYRSLVREYGRCTGKVYHDVREREPSNDGTTGAYRERTESIGWVFLKRVEYDDAAQMRRRGKKDVTYLREVWVTTRVVADEANAA